MDVSLLPAWKFVSFTSDKAMSDPNVEKIHIIVSLCNHPSKKFP